MITLEQFNAWIDEMREMYEREQKQAILQRNMDKAVLALAGQDACDRLRNYVPMRAAMSANVTQMRSRKK